MNEASKYKTKENERQYKQYLSCGYTEKFTVDKYGRCCNKINRNEIEKIDIFRKNNIYGLVEIIQLPNKNWTTGSQLSMSSYGYGSCVTIWHKQYKTKNEAIEEELNYLESNIKPKDLIGYIKNAIKTYRNSLKEPEETTLF